MTYVKIPRGSGEDGQSWGSHYSFPVVYLDDNSRSSDACDALHTLCCYVPRLWPCR